MRTFIALAAAGGMLLFRMALAASSAPAPPEGAKAPSFVAPQLEKSVLFASGESGYELFRIPGIIVTRKGTVLAYCEARRGVSDWGTINIMLRRSTDSGKTWDIPRHIAHQGVRVPRSPVALEKNLGSVSDQTVDNAVAIAGSDGTVHLVYCVEYGRVFYMKSADDGITWSNPVDITNAVEKLRPVYNWRVVATGPGHGIQLKNNRLLIPLWLSTSQASNGHGPACTATLYSDDNGATWQAGTIAANTTEAWKSPGEPTSVQLANGNVMLNMRNSSKADRRLVVTSPDGATNWSTPRFDDSLLEPGCMGSLMRLSFASSGGSGGKNRLLFSNPDTLEPRPNTVGGPGTSRARKNLSVKMSYDEGQTWPVHRVLEAGTSAYSDMAVLPNGTILCLYEGHRTLMLARFNLEWLSQGKDSLAGSPR